MQYIHLSNDSYIINTSQGMHTLTREAFHFNKIKRLLSNDAEEEKILPLLKTPELPDGIYKAYIITNTNKMYYVHIVDTERGVSQECKMLNNSSHMHDENSMAIKFVGIYASKEELILDWPEYTI